MIGAPYVAVRRSGSVVVLEVRGEMDERMPELLREKVQRALRADLTRIVVDLAGATGDGHAALFATAVVAARQARALRGQLVLASPPPEMALQVVTRGLGRLLPVFMSADAAVKHLESLGGAT